MTRSAKRRKAWPVFMSITTRAKILTFLCSGQCNGWDNVLSLKHTE